jgi:hypothetical protein
VTTERTPEELKEPHPDWREAPLFRKVNGIFLNAAP